MSDTKLIDKAKEEAEKRNEDILNRYEDGELSEDEEVVFVGQTVDDDGAVLNVEGGTLYCTKSEIYNAPETIPETDRGSGDIVLSTTVRFRVETHNFMTANGGKLIGTHKDEILDLIIDKTEGEVNFGDCQEIGECTGQIEWFDYYTGVTLLPNEGEIEHYILTEKSYAKCLACPDAEIRIDFHGQVAMIADEIEIMSELAVLESMNPMS